MSIGLPVFNGEAFVGGAIDSLLAQSYRDLELIIADNASTDGTEAICRARAARDPRVRYYRNAENLGAMRNFRLVFERARGEYFKWAAHDDLVEPDLLARCVEALDGDPGLVLAYTRSREIDEAGTTLRVVGTGLVTTGVRSSERFRSLVRRDYSCVAVFGLFRAETLRRMRMLADYADCDRVLLAEAGLAGRIVELPEALFVHRQHRNRSVWQYRSRQTRSAWFDPSRAGRPAFPYTRQLGGYLGAIRRAPIPRLERLSCLAVMGEWLVRNADGLIEDVTFAARFAMRPMKRRVVPSSRAAARRTDG